MTVGELRNLLVAFDDNMEIFASPEIRVDVISENRSIDAPHPQIHREINDLHIVGDVDTGTFEVTKRYIVLAYSNPSIAVDQEKDPAGHGRP